ncbi:aminomethyl-transferring glycine dehydrogenase [Algisphaera agarilytica]|uniref:Glycine dehydrogenase (decarboxylating) n=1 Tax=Algisphaera agarilytica TaxID=1385975 RepID=A0A7X0H609_9BACT|nr:aminomethyl-transferring glycine dehydrogenase [Algisphaera agarilytica]MBB6429697.1 glycine dehydrogenase [Algisphaera agarilytica]
MPPTAASNSTPATAFAPLDTFPRRHMGFSEADLQTMLDTVGVGSMDALIEQTVPRDIRLDGPLKLDGLDDAQPLGESAALAKLQAYADENQPMTSMIGMGYHGTITPPVILRNVLENPLWYTPYTPYQAEISQGRLEALLNFQTMVSDLVGLPLAGASLLDEGTAAAEAMAMCFNIARQKKKKFFVAEDCHPQTIAVVKTRAEGLGIEVEVGAAGDADLESKEYSGILLQYPATDGDISDYSSVAEHAHEHGALVVAATDLLACCLITPPGEWGADIAVGSAQRFGVPMGYGGPHAAFLATQEKYARKMPGRLIGVSKDVHGNLALRMAIQTREQHIKRDKATSNICTAQALLANIAGFYAVYHGPEGLKAIAERTHALAKSFASAINQGDRHGNNFLIASTSFFDTVSVTWRDPSSLGDGADLSVTAQHAVNHGYNVRLADTDTLIFSFDETHTLDDVWEAIHICYGDEKAEYDWSNLADSGGLDDFTSRKSDYLTHPVFNRYHTEHEMMRYLQRLVTRDYGLCHGMIPLGSCTMKLNAAAEMIPVTWPGFADLHPYCPTDQAQGYAKLFEDLESWLAEITGFAGVSLQPNAGSQGEYAGLMAIRSYHHANGDTQRTKCLIPTSAHGTNPASAVIAGMTVVPVACRDNGDIDMDDLAAKAEQHADELSCLMITYPSTHGVFEDTIRQACDLIHQHGGQVYMDGANMNAQVGLTSPGKIGADVCHLNLHKTFCIPHGGGGPGMGPIGVVAHLAGHLPGNPAEGNGYAISAAPYGSPMILPISWMYIAMMGPAGLKEATEQAILNANYMAARLRGHYDILYTGPSGTVAHEFIVDVRPFEKSAGITVDDFAKRLMDYGFHAPTMSWPVAGTLMIEPTESESKAELDRFCDAMISIKEEIASVEAGEWPREDNPLKGAPHTADHVTSDDWPHAYPRQTAAYPDPRQRELGAKFWPAVGRIDNPYGDRNLVCTCAPMESYGEPS